MSTTYYIPEPVRTRCEDCGERYARCDCDGPRPAYRTLRQDAVALAPHHMQILHPSGPCTCPNRDENGVPHV